MLSVLQQIGMREKKRIRAQILGLLTRYCKGESSQVKSTVTSLTHLGDHGVLRHLGVGNSLKERMVLEAFNHPLMHSNNVGDCVHNAALAQHVGVFCQQCGVDDAPLVFR